MAGYMTKLQGYIYEGELSNGTGEAVENGVLLVAGEAGEAGKLVKPAADGDTKLLCKEVTHIYDNVVAYRMIVLGLAKTYYLVENGHDVHDGAEYDAKTYKVAKDALLRAHPLLVGEEFVTDKVTGALTAGTVYGVKADGTIGA